MARSRSHYDEGHANQELNLVPYLDIMVNIVIFMLVNIVSFLSFTVLNASIPQLDTNSSQAVTKAQGEELLLILRVQNTGYLVEPTVTGGPAMSKKRINKIQNPEGKNKIYDAKMLNEYLAQVKNRFPKESKILIISKPDVNYESIILTMDAVRETGSGLEDLFSEVTLSI